MVRLPPVRRRSPIMPWGVLAGVTVATALQPPPLVQHDLGEDNAVYRWPAPVIIMSPLASSSTGFNGIVDFDNWIL